MSLSIFIRPEEVADQPAVHLVNAAAFETAAEAKLVDVLREEAAPLISLVAELEGEVVGHILFSPVYLSDVAAVQAMGLAPMAVAPMHQRKGIGSKLVQAGLEECVKLGVSAVVVLGHPDYYPRFGFKPASQYGISSEYDVPDDVFMALELQPGLLDGTKRTANHHRAFRTM